MTGRERRPGPETAVDKEDGFLGRWSKRKAKARAVETDAADIEPMVESTGDEEAVARAGETGTPKAGDPAAFDVDSLPDIDTLGPTSDFRVFMQAGVPPELKTKALRRLWRVKSELANLDGLIDYGEDLTGSFKVVDHLKTAYEVGRGFLKDDKAGEDQAEETVSDTLEEEHETAVIEETPSDTGDEADEASGGNTEERET